MKRMQHMSGRCEGATADRLQVSARQWRLSLLVATAIASHVALLMAIRSTPGSLAMRSSSPMTVRFLTAEALPERRAFVKAVHSDSPALTEPLMEASPSAGTPHGPKAAVARIDRASPAVEAAAPNKPQSDLSISAAASGAALRAGVAAAIPAVPPAPDYLTGGQLDPGPRPLQDIEPVYPDTAEMRSGAVVLRLLINESGEVDNAAVVRSSPKDLFDASALAAFGSARFSPGRVLGMPVKSQITIEVLFTPINRGSAVSGRSY